MRVALALGWILLLLLGVPGDAQEPSGASSACNRGALELELQRLDERYDDLAEQAKRLNARLAEAKKAEATAYETYRALERRISELTKQISHTIGDLQNAEGERRRQLQDQLRRLNDQRDQARAERTEAKARWEKARGRTQEIQAEINGLKKKMSGLQGSMSRARKEFADRCGGPEGRCPSNPPPCPPGQTCAGTCR